MDYAVPGKTEPHPFPRWSLRPLPCRAHYPSRRAETNVESRAFPAYGRAPSPHALAPALALRVAAQWVQLLQRLRVSSRPSPQLLDPTTADNHIAVVEHHRLPGRNRALRFVEQHRYLVVAAARNSR